MPLGSCKHSLHLPVAEKRIQHLSTAIELHSLMTLTLSFNLSPEAINCSRDKTGSFELWLVLLN